MRLSKVSVGTSKSRKNISNEKRQQTREFIRQAQAGDEAAVGKVLELNEGLVNRCAHYFSGRLSSSSLEVDDLRQVGWVAMMTAIRKFDLDRGYEFSTYAVDWILQAMGRLIETDNRTIRIPAHAHRKGLAIPMFSLDYPYDDGEDGETKFLSDFLEAPNDDTLERMTVDQQLQDVMAHLTEEEQELLWFYHGDEDREEFAARHGVSRQRMHQRFQAALRKAQHLARTVEELRAWA